MKHLKRRWLLYLGILDIVFCLYIYQTGAFHLFKNKIVTNAEVSTTADPKTSAEYVVRKVMLDAPLIKQLPELKRGCEVTALAMMLQFAGKDVSKMTLAKQVKKVPFNKDGLRGNPNNGFVGDIYTFANPGLGVYHGPLAALAEKHLPGKVVDLTGEPFSAVIKQLSDGKPVVVITNSLFKPLSEGHFQTWDTKDGEVKITYNEHSVLVTGFDDEYIYFNNPLGDKPNEKAPRADFIAAWKQLGSQAISYFGVRPPPL